MQIPVLIEPVAGNGFRAQGCEPFGLLAEGATRQAALEKLHGPRAGVRGDHDHQC